jgi:hypothetical protein
MTLKLSQFLNKTILVSIPALFEDGACRSYALRGVDLPGGLWLQSDDLSRRLLADDQQVLVSASPVVFVPFAQIAGVLIPTTLPADLVSSAQPPAAAASTRAKDKAGSALQTPAAGSTGTKRSR